MMNDAKIIKWGIIGCGKVTEVKSGPAFQKSKNSRLIAVMRRNEILAQDYAKRHNVPKCYSSAIDLVNDSEIDAVYIATPPSSHKEYAVMCAQARKAVYIEKPMAINFEECLDIINEGKKNQVPIFVAYYRRRLPRFLKIKQLIDDGSIGMPRHVNCVLYRSLEALYTDSQNLPWMVKPEISGGGLFVDLACHTLDILDFLLGPIVSVKGHASSQLKAYPAEDSVSMSFLFEHGVHGIGLWNFASHERFDNVDIVGDAGKISFSTFGNSDILLYQTNKPTIKFKIDNPEHIQQPLIESVIKTLLGQDRCPSTAESAARTNWVMDQVLSDHRAFYQR